MNLCINLFMFVDECLVKLRFIISILELFFFGVMEIIVVLMLDEGYMLLGRVMMFCSLLLFLLCFSKCFCRCFFWLWENNMLGGIKKMVFWFVWLVSFCIV